MQEVTMRLSKSVALVLPIGLLVELQFSSLTDQLQVVNRRLVGCLVQDCLVDALPGRLLGMSRCDGRGNFLGLLL